MGFAERLADLFKMARALKKVFCLEAPSGTQQGKRDSKHRGRHVATRAVGTAQRLGSHVGQRVLEGIQNAAAHLQEAVGASLGEERPQLGVPQQAVLGGKVRDHYIGRDVQADVALLQRLEVRGVQLPDGFRGRNGCQGILDRLQLMHLCSRQAKHVVRCSPCTCSSLQTRHWEIQCGPLQ